MNSKPRHRVGPPGLPGPVPKHEWDGTKIRFQKTDYSWGDWADLAGLAGVDGQNGDDAYSIAKNAGFEGTIEDWLSSLKALDGRDGKSAYQIATQNGFKGSVVEWMASLKGEKGERGATGEDGKDGIDGEDGVGLQFQWRGTELGVKREDQKKYDYADLQGKPGKDGRSGSSGGGGYRLGAVGDAGVSVIKSSNLASAVLKKLVQGANITIADNGNTITISSTGGGGSSEWGGITGTLSDQTDLKDALDLKANAADVYTKAEIDAKIAGLIDFGDPT